MSFVCSSGQKNVQSSEGAGRTSHQHQILKDKEKSDQLRLQYDLERLKFALRKSGTNSPASCQSDLEPTDEPNVEGANRLLVNHTNNDDPLSYQSCPPVAVSPAADKSRNFNKRILSSKRSLSNLSLDEPSIDPQNFSPVPPLRYSSFTNIQSRISASNGLITSLNPSHAAAKATFKYTNYNLGSSQAPSQPPASSMLISFENLRNNRLDAIKAMSLKLDGATAAGTSSQLNSS